MSLTKQRPIIVGITGASGSILAFRLIQELLNLQYPVELVLTQKAFPVIFEEIELKLTGTLSERAQAVIQYLGLPSEKSELLSVYDNNDLGAPPSSGTHLTQGMVIIPCSMGTLGKIANGLGDNLVSRSADVTMKESRKLIIVPRESPLNQIHIKNLLTLSQCGVSIIPPVLTFYLPNHQSMEGQVNYTVGKVLDQLGIEHNVYERWPGKEGVKSSSYQ